MPVVRFKGNKLDPATIKALVAATLVNGSTPTAWWKRQTVDFRNTFMDTVRTSMRNGESLTQSINRIVGGTIDGVTVPGIMKTTKQKAGALVSTSMSAVTNEAALKSYQANNDVIKAVTQLSTLDNRTSDVCIAYSGQTWNVNTLEPIAGSSLPFNGGPPRHFNCRSRLRPVTKSFRELGLDKDEIPAGTRASMDGQVPADITFDAWLKGKNTSFQNNLLGPKRAQLWRDDKISLTQLVDMRGNPMTLTQIEQNLGLKPKPSFNPATNKTINKPSKETMKAELAKTPTKPKLLDKGALKDLADDIPPSKEKTLLDAVATVEKSKFNGNLEAALAEGEWAKALSVINAAPDSITDDMRKAAMKQVNEFMDEAEKRAKAAFKKHKFAELDSNDAFNSAATDAMLDTLGNDIPARKLFVEMVKKLKDEKRPFWDVKEADTLLKLGDIGDAKNLLGQGKTHPVKTAKLKEIEAGQKQVEKVIQKVALPPEKPLDIDAFDDMINAVIKGQGNMPEWAKAKVLDHPLYQAARTNAEAVKFVRIAEKALDDLDLVKAKELIESLPDSLGAKFDLRAKLQALEAEAEKVLQQKVVKWQDNAKSDLKQIGVSDDIIESLENELETLGKLKNGVWDNASSNQVMMRAVEVRDLRDDAMDAIKALNKQSKGTAAMADFHNNLPMVVRFNDKYNDVFEKQFKLAKQKAAAGKKQFLEELEDTIGWEPFTEHFELIKEVSEDIAKKLGKKQLQDKINTVKTQIESIKSGGNVNMSAFNGVKKIDYAVEIEPMLGSFSKEAVNDVIRIFKANGNDPAGRSKLFEVLGGKTEAQQKLIKNYIHQQVNPKNLPSGKNWDEAVADIVTRHANNATHKEIQALLTKHTDGMDLGMATNFEQTILTRAGVKNFDELGVVPEGAPTPAVERLRKQLDDFDPGEVPLGEFSAKEMQDAAKKWISHSDTADERFLEFALERGKQHLANSTRIINEGENIYGKGAWGISPEDWQVWMKDMAPKLTKYDVALMNEYTGGMASRINSGLYNGGTEFKNVAAARALNKALDKMPKYKGEAFRGTNPNGTWNADFVDARYQQGQIVTERNFGSSATQEGASFGGPIKFYIKGKGKNGAIMGHVGQYGTGEMEVLWKAGTKFRVLRKKRSGNEIKVWMEEV